MLDKDGVCTSVYDNLGDAASHIDAAKDALEEMAPAKSAGWRAPRLSRPASATPPAHAAAPRVRAAAGRPARAPTPSQRAS